TAGVLLAPGRVAQDRVGGERAPLAGGEEQRPVRVVTGRCRVAKLDELVEELGDVEVDEAVVGLDARPRRFPGVVGERDTGRTVGERGEQTAARIRHGTETGTFDAFRIQAS